MNKVLLAILSAFLCGNAMAIAWNPQPADENVADAQGQNVAHTITTLPWGCERYNGVLSLANTPEVFKDVDYAICDICESFRDLIAQSPLGADLYRGVHPAQIDSLRSMMDGCWSLRNVLLPGTSESEDLSRGLELWLNDISQVVTTAVNVIENGDPDILIPLDPNTISLIWSQLIPTVTSVSTAVLSELHAFTREKNFPEGNGVAYHSTSFFADTQALLFAPEELAVEQVFAEVEGMPVPPAG